MQGHLGQQGEVWEHISQFFYPVDTGQDKQLRWAAERPPLDLSWGQMCDAHIRIQSLNNSHCVQPDQARGLGTSWENNSAEVKKCCLSTNPLNSDQGVQWADADMHRSHALPAIQRLSQGWYINMLPSLPIKYLPCEQYCVKCVTSSSSFPLCNTVRWAVLYPFYRWEKLKSVT